MIKQIHRFWRKFWQENTLADRRPPATLVIDFGNDGVTVEAYLEKDGAKWCVSIGPDPHEGVQGFGATIHEAIVHFKDEFRNN